MVPNTTTDHLEPGPYPFSKELIYCCEITKQRFWIQCFHSRVRKKSNNLAGWLKHGPTLNKLKSQILQNSLCTEEMSKC